MGEQLWLLYLAGVPLLGLVAQWLAWRLRLPSILLLLAFGVGLGLFLPPDELLTELTGADASVVPKLLFPVVSLAVAVILFEGGLSLRFSELKQSGGVVLRLVSIGALVSWILTAAAAHYALGLSPGVSALVGAILIVTGPTVVAPLLRHIRPDKRIGSIVKWEGIVIDPVGAVLAVLVYEQVFAHSEGPWWVGAVVPLAKTIAIGGLLGLFTGWGLTQLVKRFLIPDFLHGVAFLAVALAVFALSNTLQHESGLVTVTVLGIYLANQKSVSLRHVVEFQEHLQVFLVSCLFIVLGSRLELPELRSLGWNGMAFLGLLILLVRPLSVLIATIGSSLSWRERGFLAMLAPRGIVAAAVSSVFALRLADVPGAEKLPAVAFLVIVGTVAIYGLLAAPIARLLQLADPMPQGILFAGAEPWIRQLAAALQQQKQTVMLVDTNFANVSAARMEGLPADCWSILSEHVREELDLGGIGRMLALTPNDEVNTLAVREFAHEFGRENVYQVAPSQTGQRRKSVTDELKGRLLFGEPWDHDTMAARVSRGVVKTTQLSDEFTMDDFRQRYGVDAVVAFVVDSEGKLKVGTVGNPLEPKPGDSVIAVVDE